jgi:hypothetical protein
VGLGDYRKDTRGAGVIVPNVSMVADLIDTSMHNTIVQCVESAHEPAWKYWLTFSGSFLGPLLSAAASIYVAWRVFGWQAQKDRATWIRDQQRSEWSAILSSLTTVDMRLPQVFTNLDWSEMTEGLLVELRNVIPAMRNAVFIAEALETENLIESYSSFVSDAAERIKKIEDCNALMASAETENVVKIEALKWRPDAYRELFKGFHAEADKIRRVARAALLLR